MRPVRSIHACWTKPRTAAPMRFEAPAQSACLVLYRRRYPTRKHFPCWQALFPSATGDLGGRDLPPPSHAILQPA
jgi:hypothetical protein